MDFAERLYVLRAAEGDPALLALATVELVHSELPMEEREAIKRALLAAAVPHWFDPPFLGALLAVDELKAERLHGQLCALTAVEPFSARGERAVNVHESARLALREHLRQRDPVRWRTFAERARAHMAASSSVHARIEALHHLFAIDQEAAAAECATLGRYLLKKPEWRQALAISLSEIAFAGWLHGSALVESILIPLQVWSRRGESARLEPEACAVVELAERYPYSPGLARAQRLFGDVHQVQGRLEAALGFFRKSLAILEQLVQEDPSNIGWKHDLNSFQKYMVIAERMVQDDLSDTNLQRDASPAHTHLGNVYQSQGRQAAALVSIDKHSYSAKSSFQQNRKPIPLRSVCSRTPVTLFMSYAHENAQLAISFKRLICEQIERSRNYDYHLWQDEDQLLPGANWSEEIKNVLNECDLGLLLITPSFLKSRFVTDNELLALVRDNANCIPVMLGPINFQHHDLKGLQEHIFRYQTATGQHKSLADCNPRQRYRFCDQLFEKIESRLDSLSSKS